MKRNYTGIKRIGLLVVILFLLQSILVAAATSNQFKVEAQLKKALDVGN